MRNKRRLVCREDAKQWEEGTLWPCRASFVGRLFNQDLKSRREILATFAGVEFDMVKSRFSRRTRPFDNA